MACGSSAWSSPSSVPSWVYWPRHGLPHIPLRRTRAQPRTPASGMTLDKQAERWHVKEIPKLPPLFIQTATLLFLAGLVLQALGDAPTTGRILLCLCLVGAVGYFFVTVRPLFSPSPPSSTPLSGPPQASVQKPGEKDLSEAKPTFDGCLAQILYHKLIVPQKPSSIDAVLAEVALPGFKHKWIDYLCKNDTPKILHSRYRECVTSRTMSAAERGEAITSCLLVLLSFTEAYERALAQEKIALGADGEYYKQALSKNSPFITKYGNLDETLREFSVGLRELSHGTDDRLGRLLFAVRANLLTISPVSTRAILSTHGTPPDIDHGELSSLPWGVAFQETPPAHRMRCCAGYLPRCCTRQG
ncbi:hypothetical protein FA13DRAFT_14000 [Coprinellus micaceus]|uniref:Uncharacterized protein n=1 Tax=Coprinellus micaceus TaxID=71717 RepID=A0A4Y7U044_COPMI|nr:hypothetical protein FA13DRAFT_14000 [Coprinellus micaceus]